MDFPGIVETQIRRWEPQESEGESPEAASLDEARKKIVELLEWRQERHERTTRISELIATTPSRRLWRELFERSLREAFRREERSGRYLVSTLARRVPIIRGQAAALSGQEGQIELKQISHGQEWPARESVDPVSSQFSRVAHRVLAEELLASCNGAEAGNEDHSR